MSHPADLRLEPLTPALSIYVSREHTFGTDAFLLADFASPHKGDLICDLGTGCGIIPLLWLREGQPEPKRITALDLQEKAVRQLRLTIQYNHLEHRIIPVQEDLRNLENLPAGQFHLVTCNPPYQRTGSGILSRSPSAQTARHETCCTITDVCAAASRLLKPKGRLCLCCRPQRLADVLEAMRSHGLEPKRLRFIQQRADTKPWLFLAEGKKDSRPFLEISPPLLMESNEISRIYQTSAFAPEKGDGEL